MEISAALWAIRLGKDFTFFTVRTLYKLLVRLQSLNFLANPTGPTRTTVGP